ncbi:hypothetical protein [Rhizomonospora bruguierae]|uniref:hypothetical protein n=1 Tax=Rhizomonospora bruguierae TaxID=1581705 RepID=UPI001BCBC7CF|nr:hypothetical protein [Micromonospora sp. NBRC 107566]
MQRYEYVVWFRNPALPADDEDYEWPAVFVVEAASADDAQSWGDHLGRRWADGAGEIFLYSAVEPFVRSVEADRLPVVPYGVEVSDEHIGW